MNSITRSGTTATVTTSLPHGFVTGQKVVISGATQANGARAGSLTLS